MLQVLSSESHSDATVDRFVRSICRVKSLGSDAVTLGVKPCREQLTEALQRIDVLGSSAARARAESHVWKDEIRNQLADAHQQLRREQTSHRAKASEATLLGTLLEEASMPPNAKPYCSTRKVNHTS